MPKWPDHRCSWANSSTCLRQLTGTTIWYTVLKPSPVSSVAAPVCEDHFRINTPFSTRKHWPSLHSLESATTVAKHFSSEGSLLCGELTLSVSRREKMKSTIFLNRLVTTNRDSPTTITSEFGRYEITSQTSDHGWLWLDYYGLFVLQTWMIFHIIQLVL